MKLDFIQGLQVGGIGDGNENSFAAQHQRQHAVFLQQLLIDRADRVEVEVKRIQIQQRYPKLVGGRDGDPRRVRQFIVDQVGNQAAFFGFRLRSRFGDGFFIEDTVLHQAAGQAGQPHLFSK